MNFLQTKMKFNSPSSNHTHPHHTRAFTLLEMLLVIAIIAILAGIVIIAINPGRQLAQARNAQRASDLLALHSAVQQYYIDNLDWPGIPPMTGTLTEICDEGANPNDCIDLSDLVPTYLSAIPKDPQASSGTAYKIAINPTSQTPVLTAENSVEHNLSPVQIGTTTLVGGGGNGGIIISTFGKPWRNQYFTNLTQQGNISSWTAGTAFPVTIGVSAAFVTKNRVYVSDEGNRTYTAVINLDGTIGTWTLSSPVGVGVVDFVKVNNRIYAIPASGSTVYTSLINSDGTIGSWTNSNNNLPFTANVRMEAFTTENYAYLIRANNSAEVYYAVINEDNTLGAWTNSNNDLTSTPGANFGITVAPTNNKVYLFATQSGTNVYLVANINSSGVVGSWQTVTSTGEPTFRNHARTFITNNTLYYFGGQGSQVMNYVSINTDGTLGTWNTGTNIGVTLANPAVFATNSKLYLVGGFNVSGTWQNAVRVSDIVGGKNDYSNE